MIDGQPEQGITINLWSIGSSETKKSVFVSIMNTPGLTLKHPTENRLVTNVKTSRFHRPQKKKNISIFALEKPQEIYNNMMELLNNVE